MGKQNRLSAGINFNVSAKQRNESAPVLLPCGHAAAEALDVGLLQKPDTAQLLHLSLSNWVESRESKASASFC